MVLFLFTALLVTENPAWRWPIDTANGVTAAFGEYRGNRFHMGLDFSTGGVEGLKVRPAAAGRVVRVRANQRGYGRVIYLRHANGMTSVYAHLAAFGPSLKAALKQVGKNPSAYFGTVEMDLPVTAGELIAHTGESGAGMPHFHFEVRDAKDRPQDPLTLGFPKLTGLDGAALLKGIHLLPLDPDSRVNGGVAPFTVGKGVDKVQAKGAIGVQVAAYVAGKRNSRLGLGGIRITVGDQLIGEWKPKRISFDDYRKGGLVFDQAASGFSPTTYAYCFDDRADFLSGLDDYTRPSILDVQEESRLTIELTNLSGKTRIHHLDLAPKHWKHPVAGAPKPIQATTLVMTAFENRLSLVAPNDAGSLQLPERLIGLDAGRIAAFSPQPGLPAAQIFWRTDTGKLSRWVGCPPTKPNYTYSIGGWNLQAKSLANLPALAVWLEPVDVKTQGPALEFVSGVLQFGRNGLPVKGLSVSLELEDGVDSRPLGLYYWSFNKKRWRYQGGVNKQGGLVVDLDHLSPLIWARDVFAPLILKPKKHPYFTGERIVIPLADKGSGIDRDTIRVSNSEGKTLNVDYDGDRSWIVLPSKPGRSWTVSVSDRAGLSARQANLRL